MKDPRITVGIPSKDRPNSLTRLLASLHAQTYPSWDLIVVDDSLDSMLSSHGEFWLDAIERSGHGVVVLNGAQINQAYGHNAVLWHPSAHEFIYRADDDIRLSRNFLYELVQFWTDREKAGEDIGAVGGLFFTEHVWPRDEHPPIPTAQHDMTEIASDGTLSPYAFMQEYSDEQPFTAQHLYSSYLYDRDKMRKVGGFPLTYSVGVSYHEETEAVYKLHLAGHKLYVVPSARGVHSHEDTGGTRSMAPSEHKRKRVSDWEMFLTRLPRIRAINFKPSLAIHSGHWRGVGGGERLTYALAHEMRDVGLFSKIALISPPHEFVRGDQFVKQHYDIDWHLRDYDVLDMNEEQPTFDVVVSIGHVPPKPVDLPPHRFHIHYSLYPISGLGIPQKVTRYVGISEYTARGIEEIYRRKADVIYPFVELLDPPEGTVKESSILIIGRLAGKGTYDLAMAFLEMDLPGDTVLNIVIPEEERGKEFKRLAGLASHPRVNLHVGISDEHLQALYWKSKLLWAARGFGLPEYPRETNHEHFGYTPIEALNHYCLPLAFDAGGHRETTAFLWSDLEGLANMSSRAMGSFEVWKDALKLSREQLGKFTKERFVREWMRVITSTNSVAWARDVEHRWAEMNVTVVHGDEPNIAVIGDNPNGTTAYGTIAREVCKGLHEAGMKIHMFALGNPKPDTTGQFACLWPIDQESKYRDHFRRFMRHQQFDAALVMLDPHRTLNFVKGVSAVPYHIPITCYTSQEGLPPHLCWEGILQKSNMAITYCQTGAEAIEKRFGKHVDWAYLGMDHANFRAFGPEDRLALRTVLGWDDKFVIMNIARNTRNKRIAAYIKLVKILHEDFGHDYDEMILFLHTQVVPKPEFHGIEIAYYSKLLQIPDDKSVKPIVVAPTIPFMDTPFDVDMELMLGAGRPYDRKTQDRWFRSMGMIGRYNLADLYLDMSSAEGFGMPAMEAMACEVPVISVDDSYVRSEILDGYADLVCPSPVTDQWITGAELQLVDVYEVAERVDKMMKGELPSSEELSRAKERVSKLTWDKTRERIVEAVKQCLQ